MDSVSLNMEGQRSEVASFTNKYIFFIFYILVF
jgi:hypothetical protein